jgi:hypothetical protein
LSFFDDDETQASRTSPRTPSRSSRPSPRRPQRAPGSHELDQHTLRVRRLLAAAVGIVLVIVIALVVNGCLKSHREQALKDYNQSVGQLAQESDQQVSHPLFAALAGASGKSALDVEVQIDQLRIQAQNQAAHAKSLSVPGGMTGAQDNLLLVFDLRAEGLTKVASLVRTALGGQNKQASTLLAGDMEIFLASDVIYSQRVAPLIQQTLKADGVQGQSTASTRFLPNLGWLDATTMLARLTGQHAAAQNGSLAPGTHGHALTGVSVGTNSLQPSPALNHVSGGANPTFTAMVQNGGTNVETNVKVDVTVTSAGKQIKTSHVVNSTQPGHTVSVDIPVNGVPLGVASKVTVYIEPVPGETNTENNKQTYLAVFGQ